MILFVSIPCWSAEHPDSLFKQGQAMILTHQFAPALEVFEQARNIYQSTENYEYVAYCNANMAQIYESTEDLEGASEHNQMALALLLDIGKTKAIGKIWFNQGRIHHKQRQYALSNQSFNSAIVLSEAPVQALAYNWLGINYRFMDLYDSALYYHQRSIAINNQLDQQTDVARNLSNIGQVHYLQGDYPTAIEYYSQAETIQAHSGDSLSLFKLYNRFGEVYKESGDPRNALVYLLRGQQMNFEDGTEMLRNRELIAATRQMINSQVVQSDEDSMKSQKKPGVIFWTLLIMLLLISGSVLYYYRQRIFGPEQSLEN